MNCKNITIFLIAILFQSFVYRYRVELCVDDGVDNATFVVFDREMVKLTKQDAAGLTLTEVCAFKLTSSANKI